MATTKYHFSIFETNDKTTNSAATKAVKDCDTLFAQKGYKNQVLTFNNNSKRGPAFYTLITMGILKFMLKAKRGSVVGIQYPMLNNVFKYFILLFRLKGIRFFCLIHDIESLRLGATYKSLVEHEVENLNYYDLIIVHNNIMKQWLINNGATKKMISLGVFDYLTNKVVVKQPGFTKTIIYAGNLGKSSFVYQLDKISQWKFNLYGPNYNSTYSKENVIWNGQFSPEDIVAELQGDFGLIWDGEHVDKLDDILGRYLKYNNPHKFSLYLAAGLPVIAPANSAIAHVIKQHNIGILVNNLTDLQKIDISDKEYTVLKTNVTGLQAKVTKGYYFLTALENAEKHLGVY